MWDSAVWRCVSTVAWGLLPTNGVWQNCSGTGCGFLTGHTAALPRLPQVHAKLTWHFVTDIFCDDTAVRGIWMGKHRIKMSLCVCFREMVEREGGKKLDQWSLHSDKYMLSLSLRKCNLHKHSRCQNSIPKTQAKPSSDTVMKKNGKDYDTSYEYSSLWRFTTFLKQ